MTAVDFVNVASYLRRRGRRGRHRERSGDSRHRLRRRDLRPGPGRGRRLVGDPRAAAELIAIGREIKWSLDDSEHARHPSDERLSGVYGTIAVRRTRQTQTAILTSET